MLFIAFETAPFYHSMPKEPFNVSSLSRFASKRQTASGLHVEVLRNGTHQSGAEQNREAGSTKDHG